MVEGGYRKLSRRGFEPHPPAGARLIVPQWQKTYEQRHLFFMHELVHLNHYLFYLERVADFPLQLLCDIRNHFWEFTYLAMFETSLQIAHRVAFDSGPKRLTLPKFCEDIRKHLISDTATADFEAELRDFDFAEKSKYIAAKIKFIRDKRLAHLSKQILSDDPTERPYLKLVQPTELQEIVKHLNNLFQIVSLHVSCAMTFPDLVDYTQVEFGQRHPPDVVRLLDLVARNSKLLNMPEDEPQQWPFTKEHLSEHDISSLNAWRSKFDLPPA